MLEHIIQFLLNIFLNYYLEYVERAMVNIEGSNVVCEYYNTTCKQSWQSSSEIGTNRGIEGWFDELVSWIDIRTRTLHQQKKIDIHAQN
jgi:hypothetical protein